MTQKVSLGNEECSSVCSSGTSVTRQLEKVMKVLVSNFESGSRERLLFLFVIKVEPVISGKPMSQSEKHIISITSRMKIKPIGYNKKVMRNQNATFIDPIPKRVSCVPRFAKCFNLDFFLFSFFIDYLFIGGL